MFGQYLINSLCKKRLGLVVTAVDMDVRAGYTCSMRSKVAQGSKAVFFDTILKLGDIVTVHRFS